MDVAGPFCAHCTANYGTINGLPKEILLNVFSYLDCEDLISVSKVCRIWNVAVSYAELWKNVQWSIPRNAEVGDIEAFLKNYPTVRNIKCPNGFLYNGLGYKMLKTVIKCCQDLRSLHVGDNCEIRSEVLSCIIHKFPNIQELKLENNRFSDFYMLKPLQTCLHLKILEIKCVVDTLIQLDPIAEGCPELTHLKLECRQTTSNDFVKILRAKKEKLQSLVFRVPYDNAYVIPLRECKNLEQVGCTFNMDKPPTEVLGAIASLPNLRRLELNNIRSIPSCILIKFFDSISTRNVVELSLKPLRELRDEEASAIVQCCPLIKKLSLNCSRFSFDNGPFTFASLFQLPHLEHLEILEKKYFGIWFRQLLNCQKLRHLKLIHCHDLISYNAMLLVTKLNLVYLEFFGCSALNDSFLEGFPSKVSLRQLNILECSFSEHCVEELRRQHPSIIIKFPANTPTLARQ